MTINKPYIKAISLLMICTGIIIFSSCSKKITLTNTGISPAAKAYVKIKKNNNNNYAVHLKVNHLAPSSKLNPPKKSYVVWMVTDNNGTKNIGQFQSGKGFLSKALKGSIETITPFKPVDFFITAEDDAAINYPGNMIILKSN